MQAFILAAGKGTRMRPLTDDLPKPLLKVAGKPLLQHHIERLAKAGFTRIVVNASYLGHLVDDFLQQLRIEGVELIISLEPEPLETAGAIVHAQGLLGPEPFLLVNGDVWCDYPLEKLSRLLENKGDIFGHLLLVLNPEHNSEGDFCIGPGGKVLKESGADTYTFSGLSVLSRSLVLQYPNRRNIFGLREVFNWGIDQGILTGEIYDGFWLDVGTPERLQYLEEKLAR